MRNKMLGGLAAVAALSTLGATAAQADVGGESPGVVAKTNASGGGGGDSATDPHNCHGKVQKRADGWEEMSPDIITPFGAGQKYSNVVMVEDMIGLYCKNGDRPNKFYPTAISHCYTWVTDGDQKPPYYWFDGIKVNAHAWEQSGGRNVNPPRFHIGDDESRQNCRTQRISSGKSAWLRTGGDHAPRWAETVEVELKHLPNVSFPMRGYHNRPYNLLNPDDMTILGKWRKP